MIPTVGNNAQIGNNALGGNRNIKLEKGMTIGLQLNGQDQ